MADGLRPVAAPAATEELIRKMNEFVALRKKAEDKYQQQRAEAVDELYRLEEKRATELYSTLAKLGRDQQKIKEDMAAAYAIAENKSVGCSAVMVRTKGHCSKPNFWQKQPKAKRRKEPRPGPKSSRLS